MKRNQGAILQQIIRMADSDLADDELGIQIRQFLKQDKVDTKPMSNVFKRYNEIAERYGCQKAATLTNERKIHLDARIREHGEDAVLAALDRMVASPEFSQGRMYCKWFNFNWFINPNNFVKIIEGNYDRRITINPEADRFINSSSQDKRQVFI